MNQSFEELNGSIIHWANQRNLLQKDNSFKQLAKCMSELGELSDALLKSDVPNIIDGIGDTFVTLIILAEQNGLNPVDCLNSAYEEIKNRKGITKNGTFIKNIDLEKGTFDIKAGSANCMESTPFVYSDKNGSVTSSNTVNYTLTNEQINRIIESKGAEGISEVINSVKE